MEKAKEEEKRKRKHTRGAEQGAGRQQRGRHGPGAPDALHRGRKVRPPLRRFGAVRRASARGASEAEALGPRGTQGPAVVFWEKGKTVVEVSLCVLLFEWFEWWSSQRKNGR